MKLFTSVLLMLYGLSPRAQTLSQLQSTIGSPSNAVQAIHAYPKDIESGKCHLVPVTSISLSNNTIVIVETWQSYWGWKAHTTLKGTLNGMIANGTWSSDFSGGSWTYDFAAGRGKWNKSSSKFGKFTAWQDLFFRIVGKGDIKDGFFICP